MINMTGEFCVSLGFLCICAGLRGCGHYAGCVQQWSAGLQRQTEDQQVLVAKDPEDFVQKKQLLHQDPTRRGKNTH